MEKKRKRQAGKRETLDESEVSPKFLETACLPHVRFIPDDPIVLRVVLL